VAHADAKKVFDELTVASLAAPGCVEDLAIVWVKRSEEQRDRAFKAKAHLKTLAPNAKQFFSADNAKKGGSVVVIIEADQSSALCQKKLMSFGFGKDQAGAIKDAINRAWKRHLDYDPESMPYRIVNARPFIE